VKPAPFEYLAPRSLEEALGALGDDVTPLAGGQSLLPLLNLRVARPAVILDLNRVSELDYLQVGQDGALRIGALTRQSVVERSSVVARGWPLLGQAVRFVGHRQTRSRGTVGGSVAHADPTAELPTALLALDARVHVRSASGARIVAARDFVLGPLTTALEPGELLVEVEVPPVVEGAGTAFVEWGRTHGDFATAGAAVVLRPGGEGAIAVFGARGSPGRAWAAEEALRGGASVHEVAALAAEPARDDWRRALVADLVRRALAQAAGARGRDGGAAS
jgi:CO/xanthine dehydrogenase FAD-binding subunit